MTAAMLVIPTFQKSLAELVKWWGGAKAFYTSSDPDNRVLAQGLDTLIKHYLAPECQGDPELLQVIRECWRPLPSQRPSAAQLNRWLHDEYGQTTPLPVAELKAA